MASSPASDRHAAARRAAALGLVLLAALAAGCTARPAIRPASPAVASAPTGPASVPGDPGLRLAPDSALQRLVDPHPRAGLAWLGGDIATSVPLAPDRWLWLFGDTILGRVSGECPPPGTYCERRIGPGDLEENVVGNSIGTMRFDAAGRPQRVVKHWRTLDGAPAPIFPARIEGEILWPLAALRVGRRLLVAASRHTREGGLAPVGNVFLLVANPDDPPRLWRSTVHPVPHARTGGNGTAPLAWTSGLVRDGPWIHVFGQIGVGFEAGTVIARLRAADVGRAARGARAWRPRPEYLVRRPDGSSAWRADAAMADLEQVPGLPGTSEMAFERHPALGWVTFQVPPLSFEIRMYTAPDLLGPWLDRGSVYAIPPPWSTEPQSDCPRPLLACGPDRFAAYAAKSHPELAPPGGFAVTYNVNLASGTLETAGRAAEELDAFYVPQVVAGIPAPAPAPASARGSR